MSVDSAFVTCSAPYRAMEDLLAFQTVGIKRESDFPIRVEISIGPYLKGISMFMYEFKKFQTKLPTGNWRLDAPRILDAIDQTIKALEKSKERLMDEIKHPADEQLVAAAQKIVPDYGVE